MFLVETLVAKIDLKFVSHVDVSSYQYYQQKLIILILKILLKKNKYEKDGSDFEDKINEVEEKVPDASGLVKKTNFNAKVTEIEGKIRSISGLATTAALTAVENKIPDVSSLVKKTDYNTKI